MGYPIYYDGELTVTPALSNSDAEIFTSLVNLDRSKSGGDRKSQPIVDAIKRNGAELPYYGELLTTSDDGSTLFPDEDESREGVAEWLDLLLEHFFVPRGYVLSGEIKWSAKDDSEDRGVIYVDAGKSEAVVDVIQNHGPSWNPGISLSVEAKEMVQQLVDSADGSGCLPDLTVVSAPALRALHDAISS